MADDGQAAKEKLAFEELKRRMKDKMDEDLYEDDNMFNRFLAARDFKVHKAEEMLLKHLEWRKKYDVKNISKWNAPQAILKYFILSELGYDKEGALLKYTHFGNTDYRGIFESYQLDDVRKFCVSIYEGDFVKLKRRSKEIGKLTDKVIYINNMENFCLAKATDKTVLYNLLCLTSMYLNNYPETLKTCYIINAPVYFNIFYSLIKPLLPSTVLKKVKIYSDDSWKKDLLEVVDAEILPAFLGGKMTDPDGNPLCLTIIPNPEPVPKSLYLNKKKCTFPTLIDAQKVSVTRVSTHEVPFKVAEPGSHLEWEFEVKSRDIQFGIFIEENGYKTEMVPLQTVSAVDCPMNGFYKCEKEGRYIVVFDNTSSYLRGKEICYKIKLINPKEQINIS